MSYRVFAIQSTAPIFNAQVQTSKVMKELRHWRTLKQDAGYPGYACFAQPQFACFVSLAWSRLNAKSTMGVNQLKASPDGSMFDVNLRHLNLHWKYSNTKIAMNKKDCSKLCLKRETNCQERQTVHLGTLRWFEMQNIDETQTKEQLRESGCSDQPADNAHVLLTKQNTSTKLPLDAWIACLRRRLSGAESSCLRILSRCFTGWSPSGWTLFLCRVRTFEIHGILIRKIKLPEDGDKKWKVFGPSCSRKWARFQGKFAK